MKHKIVVHRRLTPGVRAALVATAAAIAVTGGWMLYRTVTSFGMSEYERAQTEIQRIKADRQALSAQLREAKAELASLKEQVAYLSSGHEIDQAACADVRKSLSGLQEETVSLREQLSFYRGIVSPQTARVGLRVHELKISPGSANGLLRFDLVLIQSVRHERRATGRVAVSLVGRQGGASASLNLADLIVGDAPSLLFSFRYFQEFGGDFRLPAGFVPQRIAVTVMPDGSGASRVEDEFDWSRVQEKTG